MSKKCIEKTESYDLLSRVGKKVLRPGGLQLTKKLLQNLSINTADNIVEFAPGLGLTAALTLSEQPKSYIGIERDEQSVARLKRVFPNKNCSFIIADVAGSDLSDNSASKVYGEAMLTMHADPRKAAIIAEAYRILKPGGLYGIHELGLNSEGFSDEQIASIQKELALVSHVNARPLSIEEWKKMLEKQGFKVLSVDKSEMLLLQLSRMIADEGIKNFLKIIFNLISHPKERKRVFELRKVFNKHRKNLNAVAIVAQKP
nr:class I SAM-dependent methyltransferase [uncultured Pedobacter sp.]